MFLSVSISPSTLTATAGDCYSLKCAVKPTRSTNQLIITWLDPLNNTVPSGMVNATGNVSILTFIPLAASHAGTYTCEVSTLERILEIATIEVIVESECMTIRIISIVQWSISIMHTLKTVYT